MYCQCCYKFSNEGRFYYPEPKLNPYGSDPDSEYVVLCHYCYYSCDTECTKTSTYDENGNCIHLFPISLFYDRFDEKRCVNCGILQKDLNSTDV